MLLRKVLYALLSNIDSTKNLRVFRFESFKHASKALANLILSFSRWLSRNLQFAFPGCQSFLFGSVPSIVINYCISEQAVEPCHGRLVWLEVIPVLKRTQVRTLQNVFR